MSLMHDNLVASAVAEYHRRAELRRDVADAVDPNRSAPRNRLLEVVELGEGDLLVKCFLSGFEEDMWAFMVGGPARVRMWFRSRDEALLAMLAAKHDTSTPNNNTAHVYAARVLGVPTHD